MKAALASAKIVNKDIKHNLRQMEHWMRYAKGYGADIVCFGETFLQGFDCFSWDYETDRHVAISTTSVCFMQICELSKTIGIDVLFGYAELADDSIYSSCALIVAGKLQHNYRRISPNWKDIQKADHHYKEGNEVYVFEYKGKRCSIGLCGDVWIYPERFAQGEDLLFWPVYVSWSKDEWEMVEKIAYKDQALKCADKALYVNSICYDSAWGGAAYFVKGKVNDELPVGKEGLLLVDVD